ncbi:MAG: response regulator [Cypionkella sp.]
MQRIETERRVLVIMAFGFEPLFLPIATCVALMLLHTGFKFTGQRLMHKINPPRQPMRYFATLAVFLFRIVLLDMLMPQMDGLETLRCMRALPGIGPRIAVIAMSADATEPHLRDGNDLAFDGHVTKPLSAEGLAAVLLPFAAHRVPGLFNTPAV